MLINPVTVRISAHHLDLIINLAYAKLAKLKIDSPAYDNMLSAIDALEFRNGNKGE